MQLSRYNGEFFGGPAMPFTNLSSGSGIVPDGGDSGGRTRDLLLAGQALSQLSYAPGSVALFKTRALKIE